MAATEPRASRRKRIVLTTIGSLGDLHPHIAIGLGLQARGHEVIIATCECYRQKIEALSLGFRPLRPDVADWMANSDQIRRIMDLRQGMVRVIREVVLPALRESYADTLADGHSPFLLMATFSKWLAAKQSDWPPQSVVTGFPFYDQDGTAGLPAALAGFLDDGPPPVVFTLGSSAVMDAGAFYEHSAAAAKLLGRRAVLLVGKDPRNRPALLPEGVVAFDYAPYSELFPRAAVTVHAGGIGTTGLAMRSGRPMLVMPYAHDQPDNAERAARLGIARTVSRRDYAPARAALELKELLDNPAYAQRAAEIGSQVRQEDGVRAACDALEILLQPLA
jgi:UDP:flavonoid glycosyltransferase YjiC (YdhE family)